MGIVALVTGVWGGLVRLPVTVPLPVEHANWLTFHGPLMVCGFLGTVIGLERAVGLRSWWTYAAPVLAGAGGLLLLSGALGRPPQLLLTAGSAMFLLVTLRIIGLQRAAHTIIMSCGAVAWLVGNLLWLREWPLPAVVPWWILFLGLTIIGERLELTRYLKPVSWSHPALFAVLGLWTLGVVLAGWTPEVGLRVSGAGMLGVAAWLLRFDVVRTTIRHPGLPRFMAICLLGGYVWLAVSAVLFVVYAPHESSLPYGAALHAFFLGFIFLMIFAHAPVIFPSVLQLQPLEAKNRFYVHVVLLHASLLLRVGSDLATWHPGRRWGAVFNAVALAVFLLNTVSAMILARRPRPRNAQG